MAMSWSSRFFGGLGEQSVAPEAAPTLDSTLADAEQLIIYAAQTGIPIDPATAQQIIAANHAAGAVWSGPDAGSVLCAIAKITAALHPVTAPSLRNFRALARHQSRIYAFAAIILTAIIVPLSALSFITAQLSADITTDLNSANALTVSLHEQLFPAPLQKGAASSDVAPAAALAELQQYAATIRSIKDHTVQLDGFLFRGASPLQWQKLTQYELQKNLGNSLGAQQAELDAKTGIYQDVRRIAKEVQDRITLYYGALGTFFLPVAYAMLGACAYLLRLFASQVQIGCFCNRIDISARFFIALIGGMIVGLFNNFIVAGPTLPPLALAFLVGYAADVFFSFLDNLLHTVKRPAAG